MNKFILDAIINRQLYYIHIFKTKIQILIKYCIHKTNKKKNKYVCVNYILDNKVSFKLTKGIQKNIMQALLFHLIMAY